MDTAKLTIENGIGVASLYTISDICYKCPLRHTLDLEPLSNSTLEVQTEYVTNLEIRRLQPFRSIVCRKSLQFLQRYEYELYLNDSVNESECNIQTLRRALDDDLAVYVVLSTIVLALLIYVGFVSAKRRYSRLREVSFDHGTTHVLASSDNVTLVTTMKPTRLKSLDTFRGMCICVMIFVNYGGGGYTHFTHSIWNGLTVADAVFPWFVFIMGTSVGLSLDSLILRAIPKRSIFLKILRRTLTLFLLGVMVSNMGSKDLVSFSNFRVCGVLQRLALSYFFVATIHLTISKCSSQEILHGRFRDLTAYWPEWLIVLMLTILHCGVTFGVKFSDCPRGYLGPGGVQDNGIHFNCTGGAAGWLDRTVLGRAHVYQRVTSQAVYLSSIPYDPEGILGTLTSVLMCFLGLQAGKIILLYKNFGQRNGRFLAWSLICGTLAGVLCKLQINDGWIPINKNLWSVSYVLCLSSLAFLLLAICYTIIDHFNVWHGFPFYTSGMNSMLLYLGHELLARVFPVQFAVKTEHPYLLILHIYGALLWMGVATLLHRYHIYITI